MSKPKYEDVFTDSTEHTLYKVEITSENGEVYEFELGDQDVRKLVREF